MDKPHCFETPSSLGIQSPSQSPATIEHGSKQARKPISIFLWTELPRELKDNEPGMRKFYAELLDFVRSNSIPVKVTRLILRVSTPTSKCAGKYLFSDPPNSLLYHCLLQHLPVGTELRLYPYLGHGEDEDNYQHEWAKYGGDAPKKFLTAVFTFTQMWNTFLGEVNAPVRFTGVTLDMEEGIELDKQEILSIKTSYPDIPFLGISVAFDDVRWVYRFSDVVDEYYLQMYDFYTKSQRSICRSTSTSPCVLFLNNHEEMYNWVRKEIVEGLSDVKDLFGQKRFLSKLLLMWSVQNAHSNDGMYPSRGKCGPGYDFGTWRSDAFRKFLELVMRDESIFRGFAGHGVYEFAYIPRDW
jgi:hypothetical protein